MEHGSLRHPRDVANLRSYPTAFSPSPDCMGKRKVGTVVGNSKCKGNACPVFWKLTEKISRARRFPTVCCFIIWRGGGLSLFPAFHSFLRFSLTRKMSNFNSRIEECTVCSNFHFSFFPPCMLSMHPCARIRCCQKSKLDVLTDVACSGFLVCNALLVHGCAPQYRQSNAQRSLFITIRTATSRLLLYAIVSMCTCASVR